ncbi:hypothetical protein KRR39_14945 [Nocardioides panacis]|uniref:Alpha-tubulin suppressor-like RCC1 family protein n=1 Tax=Nocardioides panacis TaxID=2849501 RepID=A0A975XYZ0_9ACTN|nr:hypothetical protein [Nocardioides panacis]QWZ06818.1 hypothetical protein KRR39_14945 [Nocardioides panacis]
MPRTHRLGRVVASTTVTLVSLGGLTALAPPASAVPPTLGTVTAWGSNDAGQNAVPASLGGQEVVAVSDAINNSMALTADGKVTAWGSGDPVTRVPAGLDHVTAISAGYMTDLALDGDGKVTAWGTNYNGSTVVPASLATKTVTKIAAGVYHELALDQDGKVTAWGHNGFGATNVPPVLNAKTVTAIAASDQTSMALTSDGTIVFWGYPQTGLTAVPTSPAGTRFVDIALGNQSAMALTSDGRVVAWGTGPASVVPGSLNGKTVTAIDAGMGHNTALLSDGTVASWGSNTYGESAVPAGLTGVTQVSAGSGHTLALVGGRAGTFDTAPTASISGTPRVGVPLTASPGTVSPTPDSYTYRWFADGTAIPGADQATYVPAPAQKHTAITVTVTAHRARYVSSASTSAPTADVATNLAPTLDLTVADASIRRGSSTRLTWTSHEATGYLTAAGGWYGAQATSGTATIRQNALGATTYVLRATNANGTTTAQITLHVTRQAKALAVSAGDGLRLRGTDLIVTASRLDPAEPYTVRVAGTRVATGTANSSGHVVRTVTIPRSTDEGRARVTVTGAESDRTGRDTVRVVRAKHLGLALAKRVRASAHQSVRVTGLAGGEKVTVRYQGRRVSPQGAHADARGTYATTFGVAASWGTKTVQVTGRFAGRTAVRSFEVVRRCRVGHICG